VSEPVADELREELSRDVPVAVAPNAASAEFASAEVREPEAPHAYFLSVGNLEPRKNLPRLIQAYGLLDAAVREEFPLLLVGQQAAAFRSERSLNGAMPSGVEFLGRVSDADLATLYRGATAYVSVSRAEGFGIPVVEAASAGTGHLVLSDLPVYRWIVGPGEAIFVDPLSPESIADGLLTAATTPPDRGSTGHLATRFSWKASAEVVAALATRIDES
jgi:glycosyltransferase involved in cell wall biosynthesis